jgi:2-keto-4-pentenoate hydratase/2-oxohepta-3-ene-1,7-dioic acid hydratase in catechol pathway
VPQPIIPTGLTLAQIQTPSGPHLAVKTAQGLLDVPETAAKLGLKAPATVDQLLAQDRGAELTALLAAAGSNGVIKAEAGVTFAPVVSRPEKILCVGLNYKSHVTEVGNRPMPTAPVLFGKYNNALNHHGATIPLPAAGRKYDYEVELVAVIGRHADNVSEADALSYVAGYATGNDFTARDLQNGNGGQWLLGKSLNGSAPCGPYLVSADQVDPTNLPLECRVNGQTRQSSNTSNMIFNVATVVSFASRHMTLEPGDLIFTGTPEGVILGYEKEKQVWLKPGDEIACSVGNLGELRFTLA